MGVKFLTLKEAVNEAKISGLSQCKIIMGEIQGRAGKVALQLQEGQ